MNEKYIEYLRYKEILNEEEFIDVLNSLPDKEFSFEDVTISSYGMDDKEALAFDILSLFLESWDHVYIDSLDFKDKTIELGDVESLENLVEIKDFFSPKWTISNYDELKKDLLIIEKEEKEDEIRFEIINILKNLKLEDLESILIYVNNKK